MYPHSEPGFPSRYRLHVRRGGGRPPFLQPVIPKTGCAREMEEIIERFFLNAMAPEAHARIDTLAKLAGDVSTREYFRVTSGSSSFVICRDPALKGASLEFYPYYIVYNLFRRHRIPLPEARSFDSANGLILLDDAGDIMLEETVPLSAADITRVRYEKLIDIMVRIQSIPDDGSIPFSLSFDTEKLMFEFNFFIEHALLGLFGASLSPAVRGELEHVFLTVSTLLQRPENFVLNHRDFHCRNVMVKGDELFIIDFQDARLGLPHYDLVSLLRDSYIGLDEEMFQHLRDLYYHSARDAGIHSMGRDEFQHYFDLSAFQRNVKALGTFGYQFTRLGRDTYLRYVRRTLEYLPGYALHNETVRRAAEIILDLAGDAS